MLVLLVLLDRVDVFLRATSALTEDEVHPEPPYEIQCQSLEDRRFTRYYCFSFLGLYVLENLLLLFNILIISVHLFLLHHFA